MADEKIIIDLEFTNNITQAVRDIQKNLNKLDADLKVNADTKAADKDIKGLQSKLKSLEDQNIKLEVDNKEALKQVKELEQRLDSAGSSFSDGLIGGLAGGSLALGLDAVTSGISDAITSVIEYSAEINELKRNISATTNLEGDQLEEFASRIKATAETFDEDTSEIFKSAQKLSAQTGESIDVVLNNLQAGFLNGANASGELTAVTQEYGNVIKEVGGDSADLIAILQKSEEQGVFSDKGIDVVKEFGLRIRELPQSTQDALEGIGLNSEQIAKDLESGAKSQLDILAEVSSALGELPANSTKVGAAIADIFGGPGEDAGLKFLTSLKNINQEQGLLTENLSESALAQQRQLKANEELNKILTQLFQEVTPLINSLQTSMTELFTGVLKAGVEGFNELKSVTSALAPLLAGIATAYGIANANLIKNVAITKSKLVAEKASIVVTKAFAAVQRALNLVLNANPIGLIVTALGLLATGFTIAYQKSETFRKFIDGLFDSFVGLLDQLGFVGDAIKELLNTLGLLEDKKAPVITENLEKDRKEIEKTTEELKKLGEAVDIPPLVGLEENNKQIKKTGVESKKTELELVKLSDTYKDVLGLTQGYDKWGLTVRYLNDSLKVSTKTYVDETGQMIIANDNLKESLTINLDKIVSENDKGYNELIDKNLSLNDVWEQTEDTFRQLSESLQGETQIIARSFIDFFSKLDSIQENSKSSWRDYATAVSDLIGGLAQANKESVELQKATAVTQVLINTAVAISLAYKQLGFPFGIASAVALGAIGAVQIANILGAEDGVIGLNSNYKTKPKGKDNIPFLLAEGESVMTAKETQKNRELFEAIRKDPNNGAEEWFNKKIAPNLTNIGVKLEPVESYNNVNHSNAIVSELKALRSENSSLKEALKDARKIEYYPSEREIVNNINVNIPKTKSYRL